MIVLYVYNIYILRKRLIDMYIHTHIRMCVYIYNHHRFYTMTQLIAFTATPCYTPRGSNVFGKLPIKLALSTYWIRSEIRVSRYLKQINKLVDIIRFYRCQSIAINLCQCTSDYSTMKIISLFVCEIIVCIIVEKRAA